MHDKRKSFSSTLLADSAYEILQLSFFSMCCLSGTH